MSDDDQLKHGSGSIFFTNLVLKFICIQNFLHILHYMELDLKLLPHTQQTVKFSRSGSG